MEEKIAAVQVDNPLSNSDLEQVDIEQRELEEALSFSIRDEHEAFQKSALTVILIIYLSVEMLMFIVDLVEFTMGRPRTWELLQMSIELAFLTSAIVMIRKGHFKKVTFMFLLFITISNIISTWNIPPLILLTWTCALACAMCVVFTLVSSPAMALFWSFTLSIGMFGTAFARVYSSPELFLFKADAIYLEMGLSFLLIIGVIVVLRWLRYGFFRAIDKNKEMADKLKWAYEQMLHARDTAVKASQVKSQFLANMSHELRTPLNAIIGYTELLQEEAEDLDEELSEPFVEDLDKIQHAGEHLLLLISDVLDLTQIESGKVQVVPSTFEVAPFCEALEQDLSPLAKKGNNTIRCEVDTALGSIETDEIKLRKILTNLIDNACKFTKDGHVVLKASREQKENTPWMLFCVKDTGIGIEKERIQQLFQAFEQGDMSSTKTRGGTGLGLTIAHKSAQLLGGSLDVHSTPGEGSSFYVRIPAPV